MRSKRCRPLLGMAVAGAMAWAVAAPAAAHPHMCVSVEATVIHAQGGFTGIKQKWTFHDEAFIAQAVEGLDKNKDGKLERAELDELAKVNVEDLKGSDYFTLAAVAGQPVPLGKATDYWFEHTDGALSLHFTVPFETPVQAGAKALELAVQDRENFIAFGLPKSGAVRLSSGAPKGCRVAVEPLQGEEQATLKMILEGLGCAIDVPKAISVVCDGR